VLKSDVDSVFTLLLLLFVVVEPSAPASSDVEFLNSLGSSPKSYDIWVVESGASVGEDSRAGEVRREISGEAEVISSNPL